PANLSPPLRSKNAQTTVSWHSLRSLRLTRKSVVHLKNLPFHKPAVSHPFIETHNPRTDRFLVGGAQTEAVTAARVNVKFRRHAGALEAQVGFGQPFGNVLPVGIGAGE